MALARQILILTSLNLFTIVAVAASSLPHPPNSLCENIFLHLSQDNSHQPTLAIDSNDARQTAPKSIHQPVAPEITRAMGQVLIKEYADLTVATNQALKEGDQSLATTLFKTKKAKFLELKALGLVGSSQQTQIQHTIIQAELDSEKAQADKLSRQSQARQVEQNFLPWHEVLKIEPNIRATESKPLITSFGPDDSNVLYSDHTTPLKIFSATSGKLLRSIEHSNSYRVTARSDGNQALILKSDGMDGIDILTYTGGTNTFRKQKTIRNNFLFFEYVSQAVYNPSETKFAVVRTYIKTNLRIYDAKTGKLVTRIKIKFDSVDKVRFSPDGSLLAVTAGKPKKKIEVSPDYIYLFNTRSGELVAKLEIPQSNLSQNIEFSKDGSKLLSGSQDWGTRIWNLDQINLANSNFDRYLDGKSNLQQKIMALQPFDQHDKHFSSRLQSSFMESKVPSKDSPLISLLSPDNKQALTLYSGNEAYLWDASTGEALCKLELVISNLTLSHVTFNADGSLIAATDRNHKVYIWSAQTGKLINSITTPVGNILVSVQFSNDGRSILTSSFDRSLRVWKQLELPDKDLKN
jgi:WD40 repeat protein